MSFNGIGMKRRSANCNPMPKKQSTENVVGPILDENSLRSDGKVQYLTSNPLASRKPRRNW